jgi:hypothetical protein
MGQGTVGIPEVFDGKSRNLETGSKWPASVGLANALTRIMSSVLGPVEKSNLLSHDGWLSGGTSLHTYRSGVKLTQVKN